MSKAKPFGDPITAEICIIGHDPRLQLSDAEASHAFFMDYIERIEPRSPSERRRYSLAMSVLDYLSYLTNAKYGVDKLEKLFITNLCNRFLPHPSIEGLTVLIPDQIADQGIQEIKESIGKGKFILILPMGLQVFYHLARSGFVTDRSLQLAAFMDKAQPVPLKTKYDAYAPKIPGAFIDVCGNKYMHGEIPVIPILHVKTWRIWRDRFPYSEKLKMAISNIAAVLSDDLA